MARSTRKAKTPSIPVVDNTLLNSIRSDIKEYINEHASSGSTVNVGDTFAEWVLFNLFQFREDEVEEAVEISGKNDNGIDAIFEIEDELYIIQCKYNSSHSHAEMVKFEDDCRRLLTNEPITDREIVKLHCQRIREKYESRERIFCYYITNSEFDSIEAYKAYRDGSPNDNTPIQIATNVELYYFDIFKITQHIEKTSDLSPVDPKREVQLSVANNYLRTSSNNTIIAMAELVDFYKFVQTGTDLLFHSNIRNHLTKSEVNKGIEKTILEEAHNFSLYNNGITITCDRIEEPFQNVLLLKQPHIVNGCQTAKSIEKVFNKLTPQKRSTIKGQVLIKIVQSKEEDQKKKVTQYTNTQNAVKGLDFYALEEFHRELQKKLYRTGYYYEIQRGAYVAFEKVKGNTCKGNAGFSYFVPMKFKGLLPAKEVIQAFVSGIKQLPGLAYGRPGELTPLGDKNKYNQIFNPETNDLHEHFFLFPYLVIQYAKKELGYAQRGRDDHKRSSSLAYVAAYFEFLRQLTMRIYDIDYITVDKINIELFNCLFSNEHINVRIMHLVDEILDVYFMEDDIIKQTDRDLKNFLKIYIGQSPYWDKLVNKINYFIDKKHSQLRLEVKQLLDNNSIKQIKPSY